MRKITLLLCCLIASKYGICQIKAGRDSAKIASAADSKAKENLVHKNSPELVIYPNPAKNKVTLQVKNFNPGIASVKVLDIKGKLVKEERRLITNGTEDIIMFLMLKAGVYFILVNEPGKQARKKLVIL